MSSTPSDEDAKIVTLARMARTRAHAPHSGVVEGAALRDVDGRTYAAATVEHADPGLTTGALRGALSAAVSSGARRFEAAAVVREGEPAAKEEELILLAEFGAGVPILLADPSGTVRDIVVVPEPGSA